EIARIAPMAGGALPRLSVGGNSIYTLRATARLRRPDNRLSEVSRTVSAQVKFRQPDAPPAYQILRWNDQDFSPFYSEARAWRSRPPRLRSKKPSCGPRPRRPAYTSGSPSAPAWASRLPAKISAWW